jgi:hypothetical protein
MAGPRILKVVAAVAGLATATVLTAGSADAAPKKRVYVTRAAGPYAAPSARGQTVFTSRGEDGRTHTRIIVQKRSFLDGGTEVLPGQRKFTDYVYPPGYSVTEALGSRYNNDRQPLNGRFDFGSIRRDSLD